MRYFSPLACCRPVVGFVSLLFVASSLAAQPNVRLLASDISRKPAAARPVAPPPPIMYAQPEYPGGDGDLIAFLGQTLHYPADAYEAGAEGRVNVSFWIDERGHPYGFGVVEAPHPSLAEEALRAMRLMPDWAPGRREGRPVPLLVHVPVVFRRPANAATKALAPR